jgi:hypothetical protein
LIYIMFFFFILLVIIYLPEVTCPANESVVRESYQDNHHVISLGPNF